MTYYVSIIDSGRVILDRHQYGQVIQSIKADDYELARLNVDETNMYHNEGHGYFIND